MVSAFDGLLQREWSWYIMLMIIMRWISFRNIRPSTAGWTALGTPKRYTSWSGGSHGLRSSCRPRSSNHYRSCPSRSWGSGKARVLVCAPWGSNANRWLGVLWSFRSRPGPCRLLSPLLRPCLSPATLYYLNITSGRGIWDFMAGKGRRIEWWDLYRSLYIWVGSISKPPQPYLFLLFPFWLSYNNIMGSTDSRVSPFRLDQ